MKELTAEDIRTLQHGDVVYRWDCTHFRKLRFVGPMPGSTKHFIFCDGEYLTYLFISKDDNFANEWYSGEYDSKFVGNLKLAELNRKIEGVKKIYFK